MGERRRIGLDDGGKILKAPFRPHAQALVELALILPILLLLVIGALEFGRMFYTKIILTNAAREGAYYMTTHSSTTGICDSTCVNGTINASQTEASSSGIEIAPVEVTHAIVESPVGSGIYMGSVTVQVRMDNLIIFGAVAGTSCPYIYPDDPSNPAPGDGMFSLCSSVEMMVQ